MMRLAYLARAGYALPANGDGGRKLVLDGADGRLRFIMVKPADVPVFVEYGAADVGIAGLDVVREAERDVYEPLRLPFGYCRLVVAGQGRPRRPAIAPGAQPAGGHQVPAPDRSFLPRARRGARDHRHVRLGGAGAARRSGRSDRRPGADRVRRCAKTA